MAMESLAHAQNFLHSTALVKRLIGLTSITPDDLVVEIGPGKGIITRQLAGVCAVEAVEYDTRFYRRLKDDFAETPNVVIRYGDFLDYRLPGCEYKVFANIPFNITSAILAKITQAALVPADAYLIIQREAALNYAGQPYARESLKSLLLKPRFDSALLHEFTRMDFTPAPDAEIVLLHLHKRADPRLRGSMYRHYRDFLCYVFSQHGKDIGARLKSVFTPPQFKRLSQRWRFSPATRIVDLSFEQWLGLFAYYAVGVSAEKQQLIAGAEARLMREQNGLVKVHRNHKHRI